MIKKIFGGFISVLSILGCLALGVYLLIPLLLSFGFGSYKHAVFFSALYVLLITVVVYLFKLFKKLILSNEINIKSNFNNLIIFNIIIYTIAGLSYLYIIIEEKKQETKNEEISKQYVKENCIDVNTPSFSYKKCRDGWRSDVVPEEHKEEHLEYIKTFINLQDSIKYELDYLEKTKEVAKYFQNLPSGWTMGDVIYDSKLQTNKVYFNNINGSYAVCIPYNCQLDSEVFLTK